MDRGSMFRTCLYNLFSSWVNLFKSLATIVNSELDKLSAVSTINKPLTFDIAPSGVTHNAPHESEVYNIIACKAHAALHVTSMRIPRQV